MFGKCLLLCTVIGLRGRDEIQGQTIRKEGEQQQLNDAPVMEHEQVTYKEYTHSGRQKHTLHTHTVAIGALTQMQMGKPSCGQVFVRGHTNETYKLMPLQRDE